MVWCSAPHSLALSSSAHPGGSSPLYKLPSRAAGTGGSRQRNLPGCHPPHSLALRDPARCNPGGLGAPERTAPVFGCHMWRPTYCTHCAKDPACDPPAALLLLLLLGVVKSAGRVPTPAATRWWATAAATLRDTRRRSWMAGNNLWRVAKQVGRKRCVSVYRLGLGGREQPVEGGKQGGGGSWEETGV